MFACYPNYTDNEIHRQECGIPLVFYREGDHRHRDSVRLPLRNFLHRNIDLNNPVRIEMMPIPTLQSLPLFQGLDQKTLDLIVPRFEYETFQKEEIIFDQNDRARKLYILVEGRVEIRFKPEDGEQLTVTEIETGGVFGWSAALRREVYTSGAVSVKKSTAFSVLGEELKQLCEQYPDSGVIILERLAEVIAQRLQKTHTHVVEMLREGVKI